MQRYLFPLLACGSLTVQAASILDHDLLFVWTDKDKAIDLTEEQKGIATGKDAVVSAMFRQDAGPDIRKEHNSYLGIRRANDGSQNNSFSCAGGLNGELIFTRAEPGADDKSAVIDGPYELLTAPAGVTQMITLNQIADALDASKKVAITILRTPAESAYDIMAVSVYDPKTDIYQDYAVGLKIAGSSDTGTFDQVNFYKQRFAEGNTIVGKDYELKDAIDATHSAILGRLIPEPATATLGLLGIAALGLRRRRKLEVGGWKC